MLLTNCSAATFVPGTPFGLIDDAAIVVSGDALTWVGSRKDLPQHIRSGRLHTVDLNGAVVTPGLIDCHTHLVYGGTRAREFEMRLSGASYEEISRAGGGIASTVRETRAASFEELSAQSGRRLRALISEGVTTVEIKSGYGLSLEHERRCLEVARSLATTHAVDVRTTFLGAHALPPEFMGRSDEYIDCVIEMLPLLHAEGLVDAVDGFCERIAFSSAQIERVFVAATRLGLPVKLHAEQLSDAGGAILASRYGALSCDHLEFLTEAGAHAMAHAGVTAVLLPVAYYYLRETKLPPIDLLRHLGIPMAVSTDCNPGTSPCASLLLAVNMASTLFRLTPEEALAAVTRNAARALGLHDRGVLAPGLRADLVAWDIDHPRELAYAVGGNPRQLTVHAKDSSRERIRRFAA